MNTVLSIPDGVDVKENTTSYYWFDENGILCSVNKKVPPIPFEQIVKEVDNLKQLAANNKLCMLMDVTHSPSSNKQTREYTAQEFPKLVKALALVTGSTTSRLLAYLFFALVTTPFPSKMFANEHDAKEWLKQYL